MSAHIPQDPEEDLPEWLKALRRKQGTGDLPPEEPPSKPALEPVPESSLPESEPEWLAEIRRRRQSEQAAASQPEEREPLSDTQPNPPLRLEKRRIKSEPEPAPEPEPEPMDAELPDWSEQDLEAEESENMIEEGSPSALTPVGDGEEEELTPGELPSWLQAIRPGGSSFPKEDERSDAMLPPGGQENVGPLAGLSGVLQAEPEIARMGKAPVFSSRLEVTDSQYRHAAALRDLVADEALPQQDEGKRVARPIRLQNTLMAAVLIIAVLIPIITGSQAAPRPATNAFPENAGVFNLIETLPTDSTVLVAFDVEPALYGELKVPMTAVFGHLLDRQARLAFISTQPTGPALAERLLQEEFATSPIVATYDYVNLGYLSGGMAALRSFSSDPRAALLSVSATLQDPWQSPSLQSIDQLSDFGLVLVVVSDAEDGRAWIEQTGTSLPNGLAVVSSAQSAPLLLPYTKSDPVVLRGLVSGLTGGAYYESLRAQDGLGRSYWDSYSYGLGVIVLLILLGGLYGRFVEMRPEKPPKVTQG